MVLASTSVTALLVTSTFCRERRGVGFHNPWGAGGRTGSPWTAPAPAPPPASQGQMRIHPGHPTPPPAPTRRNPAVVWLWPGRVTELGFRQLQQLSWYLLHFFEVFIKLGPFSPSDLLADQLGDRRRETSVSLREKARLCFPAMSTARAAAEGVCPPGWLPRGVADGQVGGGGGGSSGGASCWKPSLVTPTPSRAHHPCRLAWGRPQLSDVLSQGSEAHTWTVMPWLGSVWE